jgi:PTH1 family peptidyl-tRNA hydrolase
MSEPLYLIAGLGNPGEKYRDTRHNVGFWAVDCLATRWKVSFQNKFKAEYALASSSQTGAAGAILLKPQTFMNLSGQSIAEAARFYKIPLETHLLVLSDDLDLPAGALRLRLSGGAGGHNGLRSVNECLGTQNYPRLRMGIGRSATLEGADYVLAKIPRDEKPVYEKLAEEAANGVERCLKEGIAKAMNTVNQRSVEK